MKTTMIINEIHRLQVFKKNEYIFIISLTEGNMTTGKIMINPANGLKFKILGVGLENKPFDKNSVSVLIESLTPMKKIEQFQDKIFVSED